MVSKPKARIFDKTASGNPPKSYLTPTRSSTSIGSNTLQLKKMPFPEIGFPFRSTPRKTTGNEMNVRYLDGNDMDSTPSGSSDRYLLLSSNGSKKSVDVSSLLVTSSLTPYDRP